MPIFLPTAVVGNDATLITLGHSAEIMAWFYPSKDHAQHIHQCMPCVYVGTPGMGKLYWTWGEEWDRRQEYRGDTNICVTHLQSESLALELEFTDICPPEGAVLVRRVRIRSHSRVPYRAALYHYGDWNMDGVRTGNALQIDRRARILLQSHRASAVAIGGDALEMWQCGKAGDDWASNARQVLEGGVLHCQDLEIGDVNWAFGFEVDLPPGGSMERTAVFAMGTGSGAALDAWRAAAAPSFVEHLSTREKADQAWLVPGLNKIKAAPTGGNPPPQKQAGTALPLDLQLAYRRSLLCLPLLCGVEGAALAAPEFDPEFISCGGYGYLWPRDGAEYVSGLMQAGYPEFAIRFFDWSARHQDPAGFWHQRYFLNGEPGPNWCLPPETLQIDQVGAVLWAYGKWLEKGDDQGAVSEGETTAHREMIRRAADYLLTRLTPRGVHANAFDTWESFIGSFTYSNAAIYAAFRVAARVLGDERYTAAADRVKDGVLEHFVHDGYLVRGFNGSGDPDLTVDSSSLGAIAPFELLDLNESRDLQIAEKTLAIVAERLEVDWEGGRAIRRFEGDAYVGGVPACVNTLWMARCCLNMADRFEALGRKEEAAALTGRSQIYLSTVLRRATPTGLLPELMQGPTGQQYWAAPHGWAMASFVSGVLHLAQRLGR